MSGRTTRLLAVRVHLAAAWHHVRDWLILQGEYLAIGRTPITLTEVERDRAEYHREYSHKERRITVGKNKSHRTVTVTEQWKRHRDDYVKTGSLASFRHMIESVTVTMSRTDPNDTPRAIR